MGKELWCSASEYFEEEEVHSCSPYVIPLQPTINVLHYDEMCQLVWLVQLAMANVHDAKQFQER